LFNTLKSELPERIPHQESQYQKYCLEIKEAKRKKSVNKIKVKSLRPDAGKFARACKLYSAHPLPDTAMPMQDCI
jgi:hypothetical protein